MADRARAAVLAESMMKKQRYQIDIVAEADGKGFYVVVPALPGCFSAGRTIEQAMANAAEAIALHLRCLRDAGEQAAPAEPPVYHAAVEVAA